MRLISLEIHNFRVLKNVRLDFPDKVIGIIGPNGAGKSSLIEAISWALYGNQVARSGKEEIKAVFARPTESCEVKLAFEVNGINYQVVRRLVGKNERGEVELYRDGKPESIGVSVTRHYVGELLGLDWRGFLTSFLARQQELNALSDLQPTKRRDHLAGMLGIERLDKAIQKVKEDTRAYENQISFLERQLAETESVKRRIEELHTIIADVSQQVTVKKQTMESSRLTLERQAAEFQKKQHARSTWLQLTAKLEAEVKTEKQLIEQKAVLRTELAKLADYQREKEALGKKLAALPERKKELESLKAAKSRLELRQELTSHQHELSKELKQLEEELKKANSIIQDYERQLQTIPEDITTIVSNYQHQLDEARNEFTRLKAQKAATDREINKLREQLASIAELGPDSVCDRCLRPFGDSLPEIREHLNKVLSELQETGKKLKHELKRKEDEGKKLKQQLADFERQAQKHQELSIKRENAVGERDRLTARQESLRQKYQQVTRKITELGTVSFDESGFVALAKTVRELEQDQLRYKQLQGELSRKESLERNLKSFEKKLETAKNEIAALKHELEGLDYKEEEFLTLQQAFEKAQRDHEHAKTEYFSISKELELNQKELEGKLEQLKRFEHAAEELETFRTNHYYGNKLARLFSDFRAHLIAQIRPTLAEFSSKLISEMTNGKYNLVELDEKYNLRILDTGQYYGVDRFSGGEKDLANLCLRLAISLALTESAGLQRSFIILDEVFGSQDNERKELIIKALANLKQRFPQIFLITHIEEIRDQVEQLIEVVPTGLGWSEVKVDGVAA